MAIKIIHNGNEYFVGDTVKVNYKIKEKDKERLQAFDGIILAIKGAGENKNFVVAKDEISKLKSVAHHLRILQLYNQFESLEKILHDEDTEASNDALLHLTQTIQAFKDIVQ